MSCVRAACLLFFFVFFLAFFTSLPQASVAMYSASKLSSLLPSFFPCPPPSLHYLIPAPPLDLTLSSTPHHIFIGPSIIFGDTPSPRHILFVFSLAFLQLCSVCQSPHTICFLVLVYRLFIILDFFSHHLCELLSNIHVWCFFFFAKKHFSFPGPDSWLYDLFAYVIL